jgi:hypothetical protein
MYFVLLLLLFVRVDAVLQCLSRTGYVTSVFGELCAECQFEGSLIAVDQCVYVNNQIPLNIKSVYDNAGTTTNCSSKMTQCRHQFTGQCVTSRYGIMCAECNGRGQLIPKADLSTTECSCYSSSLDPKSQCAPTTFFQNVYEWVNYTRIYKKVECIAHQSDQFGCYDTIDSSGHKYGTPDPPVPYRCCNERKGPPPGETVEVLQAGVPFQDCNTPGTENPDLKNINDTSFRTCSGHGIYNFTTRECQCDKGWDLAFIGYDAPINITRKVTSCNTCYGHWGPEPYSIYGDPPYCNRIFSPDPITGHLAECGGRGIYIDDDGGSCSCYGNSTIGYWALGNIGGRFDYKGNEVIAQSCVNCEYGKNGTGFPLCL